MYLSNTRKSLALLETWGFDLERFFASIPSTTFECETDWRHAIAAFVIDELYRTSTLTRPSALHSLSSDCFFHFEGIYLEDLKRSAAYRRWLGATGDLHSDENRIRFYFEGCNEILDLLQVSNKPLGPHGAVKYLCETYLNTDGGADLAKTQRLVAHKSQRLTGHVADPGAVAWQFVNTFYNNVYRAMIDKKSGKGNLDAITETLKAVRNGGSGVGLPSIVNGFETLLLLLFLDGAAVREVWNQAENGAGHGITREATL
jgi:hypothetical protein